MKKIKLKKENSKNKTMIKKMINATDSEKIDYIIELLESVVK